MNDRCSSCQNKILFLKAIFASKSLPIKCGKCKTKNYREHQFSYFIFAMMFSLGLFILAFIFISKGSYAATLVGSGYLILFVAVYMLEYLCFDLKEYDMDIERKLLKQGKNNILLVLIIIVVSLLVYYAD